jgi:hypothetical protein
MELVDTLKESSKERAKRHRDNMNNHKEMIEVFKEGVTIQRDLVNVLQQLLGTTPLPH